MNKKFSTLMALALLAGSFPVAAQYCPQNGEVPYHTRLVKSAKLDAHFQDVYKINENYWYQLQVDPASLTVKNQAQDAKLSANAEYVLTVERDYSTGKLYLTARPSTDAVLTHSLWQIKPAGRDVNGKTYVFVNKETGFELTYDHYNALKRSDANGAVFNNPIEISNPTSNFKKSTNYGWDFEKDGLQDGCNSAWDFYTNKASDKPFDYSPLYSYFHAGDSVMFLRSVPANYADEVYGSSSSAFHRNISSAIGVNGTSSFAVVAVKESEAKALDLIDGVNKTDGALRIKPVVAGAKVLNAEEINTMIDADGSWMTFPNWIKGYAEWNDGDSEDEDQMKSRYTKFTVLKPGHPDQALTIADGTNPFDGEFKAVQSTWAPLNRDNYPSEVASENYQYSNSEKKSVYAGYNILFETKEPLKTVGKEEQYGYLYVHEHNFEKTPTGTYNGLKVVVQPYAFMYEGEDGKLHRQYKLDYIKDEATASVTDPTAYPDPLEARYFWKVTYYATNDSVVLEPLNASRMIGSDMKDKKAFEETELAKHWAKNFLNTVNPGISYGATYAPDPTTFDKSNGMYNKAPGVPVALYAINNAQVGDDAQLITVGVPTALTASMNAHDPNYAAVVKKESGNPAYVTNNSAEKYKYAYQSEMELRLRFANNYTHLQRATVESGLYYINLQSKKTGSNPNHTENREFGAYIVEDMMGHVVYDASQKEQDFSHMPATQWVVEQQQCLKEASDINYNKYPTVRITNREFANNVFDGQLYKDANGNLFTINHRDYNWAPVQSTVDNHVYTGPDKGVSANNGIALNCADTIAFEKVANPTTLGYFNAEEDVLRENVYNFKHLENLKFTNVLGIQDLAAQMDTLRLMPETADDLSSQFELFRAEGWYPEMDYKTVIINGEEKVVPAETYSFNYVDSLKYGYASEAANAPQLYKTYYKVKLKDANLIDNDHRFLAVKNQHKYVIAREADILNPANNLEFAIVSLKENNCIDGTHAYAMVNAERYTFVNVNNPETQLKNLSREEIVTEYGKVYEVYYDKKEYEDYLEDNELTFDEIAALWKGGLNSEFVKKFARVTRAWASCLNADGDYEFGTGEDLENPYYHPSLNNYNMEGKLEIENATYEAKVATNCETTSDAFAVVPVSRRLYRTLDNELVLNDKKAIDIKTVDIQGNESLIEDSHSSQSKLYKMNYLGVENYGNPSENEGFYVDFVQASKDSRMPQYMFVVAADSVPAYEYCDCGIDGHAQHGINSGCGHSENYAGYVDGRFLVNFNDSVKASIDKLIPGIDKFAFDNYTRLGFVEAVHRGDSLYVLKAPYTLESIKEEAKDGSGKYIIPTFLSKEKEGEVYDIVPLDGKHNNAVFALRNTEDDENSFLIESNDCFNNPETGKPMSIFSKVGSFAGAWIKIHNNVPVLAKVEDKNGNHNTGDTTDSWLNMGDWVTGGTYGELINQAARFTFNTIDKDSQATANEEIATSSVVVAGTNGAVVVKGAEGKNVIVSTILGKVVANEVVSSDNATIAAPAGVVVVSVDGESFKVVVK